MRVMVRPPMNVGAVVLKSTESISEGDIFVDLGEGNANTAIGQQGTQWW